MSGFNEGVAAAVALIRKEADDFAHEYGSVDPDTGTLEFGRGDRGEANLCTHGDMLELADRIEKLKREPIK